MHRVVATLQQLLTVVAIRENCWILMSTFDSALAARNLETSSTVDAVEVVAVDLSVVAATVVVVAESSVVDVTLVAAAADC